MLMGLELPLNSSPLSTVTTEGVVLTNCQLSAREVYIRCPFGTLVHVRKISKSVKTLSPNV